MRLRKYHERNELMMAIEHVILRIFVKLNKRLGRQLWLFADICSMGSIRQEKFAKLVQKELASIFQEKSAALFENAFITVSHVEVSPDLGYAKIFISFLNGKSQETLFELVNMHSREVRHMLASRIRNQARKVPELHFILDSSLDYVQHMEEVFKRIKKKDE
jgi:ribosome-binding factor A